jgi:DNA topoisomerase-1
MGKTLVIVESPAKCKKIESYLGDGYRCIASYGHIQGLDNSRGLRCIDVEHQFRPVYVHLPEKQQQIQRLISECGRATEVILATDDDREGEAIAWHICMVCGLSVETTKRILFHEITKPAITQAVQNPTRINMNTIYAQQARQILDFVVGYTISPILWEHISRHTKEGLSAGRCQTPALRLVYDNQKDIDQSPGKKVYNTTGYFTSLNLPFQLNHHYDSEGPMETFLEESVNLDHVYSCQKPRETKKQPPTPFTTSMLQQTASSVLHITPKDTMRICQKLYEGGYITYMRTDSKTLSKEFLETVEPCIKEKYGENYVRENLMELSERAQEPVKKSKKSKKSKKEEEKESTAQEAHEAIRPTDITREKVHDTMEPREKKMYQLIWRTTMEACMATAQYLSLTATITSYESHQYRYSTEKVVFPGWKAVGGYEEDNPIYPHLLSLKNNNTIEYKKIESKVTMKELKSHYTEAKLISLLEQKGIGRPSTFSSLLDKIQERGYVKKENVKGKAISCTDYVLEDDAIEETISQREFGNEKGKLVVQPTGYLVVEFLIKHFPDLFEYGYTKQMEDRLDKIAKAEEIWYELCRECYQDIQHASRELVSDKVSIAIDEYHTYIIGKYGPVLKYSPTGDKKDISFKAVKKDLDMEALKAGSLSLEDILEVKDTKGRELGEYQGSSLYVKKGKFGLYVEWGEQKRSLKTLGDVAECDITYDMVVNSVLSINKAIVREITKDMSIRTGRYGAYIYYKTAAMGKPSFKSLKGFKEDYEKCSLKKVVEYYNQ